MWAVLDPVDFHHKVYMCNHLFPLYNLEVVVLVVAVNILLTLLKFVGRVVRCVLPFHVQCLPHLYP